MRFQLNVERLKNKARKLELKDQPEKAIEVYQEIIDRLDGTPELSNELGLYNKIGDLYLKVRNVNSAVEMYERAADLYTESGFPNNAIALCNKILRSAPGRTHVYLKLGQLMLQRRFMAEAKRNLIEYASRMADGGKFDQAFDELQKLADLSPDNEEFRLLLAEQLRAHARDDGAREQIDKLLARTSGAQVDESTAEASDGDEDTANDRGGLSEELIFLDLSIERPPDPASVASLEASAPLDLEPTSVGHSVSPSDTEEAVDIEPTSLGDEVTPSDADGEFAVESVASALEADEVRETAPLDGLEERTELEIDDVDSDLPIDLEQTALGAEDDPASDLDFLSVPVDTSEGGFLDLPVPTLDVGDFGAGLASDAPAAADPPETGSLGFGPLPGELDVDAVFDTPPMESDPEWLDARASSTWDAPTIETDDPTDIEPKTLEPATFDPADFGDAVIELSPSEPLTSDVDEIEIPTETEPMTLEPATLDPADLGGAEIEAIVFDTEDVSPGDLDVADGSSEPSEDSVAAGLDAGDMALADVDSVESGAARFSDAARPDEPDEVQPADLDASVDGQPGDSPADPPFLVGGPEGDDAPLSLAELKDRVEQAPDDAQMRRTYAEALLEAGDLEGGLAALDESQIAFEATEDWGRATAVVDEMIRIDPSKIDYHQRRVELAHRSGDDAALIRGSMDLAGALFRSGELDQAQCVYEQVLELDPDNESAREALAAFRPPEAAAGATETDASTSTTPTESNGGGYVDLSDLIMGDDLAKRDTRMRVEDEEPTGDEQQDFNEMLLQFRRGIEENLDEGDAQAHYDLGVAFKEMALLDEAISEFQKALRNSDTRLQSAEMLGLCFIEKGQFEVAATVLRRGIDRGDQGDEDKVGLLYWLGRCEEEQGRPEEALRNYRRVFAIDIRFEDVAQRVEDLVKAGS